MSIISLILALVLEQFRPVSSRNRVYLTFVRLANRLERNMNDGEYRNGALAWLIAVLPLALLSVGVYWYLCTLNLFLRLAFSVLVLWLTMGFRQFSSAFTGISKALQLDDLPAARVALADWTGLATSELTEDEGGSWRIKIKDGPEVMIGSEDQERRMQRFRVGFQQELAKKLGNVRRVDLRYTNGFAVEWKKSPVGSRDSTDGVAGVSDDKKRA